MGEGQQIAVVDTTPAPAREWTPDQVALVKRTIAAEATDDELKLFIIQCQRTGLDPFTRQIYVTFVWDKKLGRKKMQIQATIDGFRVVAGRSHEYAGQVGPFWCGANGEWKDIWLSKSPPAAAKVGAWRKGFAEPLYAIALWDEYAKTRDGKVEFMWAKMPALMLAKCAEALALRKAFPNDLSGLYTTDEMAQATPAAPQTPSEPPQVTPEAVEGEVVDPEPTAPPIADLITDKQRPNIWAIKAEMSMTTEALYAGMRKVLGRDVGSSISLSAKDPDCITEKEASVFIDALEKEKKRRAEMPREQLDEENGVMIAKCDGDEFNELLRTKYGDTPHLELTDADALTLYQDLREMVS